MFEWTDTESCIVQLLRILPSIRQPPQHLKVAARAAGHPSLHRSFPLPKCRPPSPSSPTPTWTSCLARPSAEARGSRVKSILRLIPSFSAAVRKQAKRSRDPVPPSTDGFFGGASLRLCTHRSPWHCSACPVCGASYVHIIIREALVFGFARWMDGRNG